MTIAEESRGGELRLLVFPDTRNAAIDALLNRPDVHAALQGGGEKGYSRDRFRVALDLMFELDPNVENDATLVALLTMLAGGAVKIGRHKYVARTYGTSRYSRVYIGPDREMPVRQPRRPGVPSPVAFELFDRAYRHVEALLAAESYKAAKKGAEKARVAALVAEWKNPYAVGDVLASCWGYDATFFDFVEVVEVLPRSVRVVPLGKHRHGSRVSPAVAAGSKSKGKVIRFTFSVWGDTLNARLPAGKYRGSWSPYDPTRSYHEDDNR